MGYINDFLSEDFEIVLRHGPDFTSVDLYSAYEKLHMEPS